MSSFLKNAKKNMVLHSKEKPITTLQVNIGRRCNQACFHCHVESSPHRKENMELKHVDRLIELIDKDTTYHNR